MRDFRHVKNQFILIVEHYDVIAKVNSDLLKIRSHHFIIV